MNRTYLGSMAWQWTSFTLPFALGFLVLSLLALYLARQWGSDAAAPGIRLATGVVACLAVTVGLYVLDVSSVVLETNVLINQLEYIGLAPLTPLMLAYVLVYVGRGELLTPRTYALLFLPAVLTLAVVFTNDLHGWFWPAQRIDPGTGQLVNEFGPAYVGFFVYTYVYGVASVALLVREAADAHGVYLRQVVALIVGIAAPLVGGVVYVLGLVPDHYPTPTYAAFVVTAVAFGWPAVRYDLFGLVPIARRTLLSQMEEAVVACNDRGVVVTANDRAADLLSTDREALIGANVDDAFAPIDAEVPLGGAILRGREERTTATVGDRVVDVSITPHTQSGHRVGQLVVLTDVTGRHDRERQLSRQNAYLDEFAEVVSHDIATPLGVIENRARLVELTGDSGHVEDVFESTDRIRRLMDELLELARQGKRISETEPVDLASVVEDAWTAIDTGGATLSVAGSRRIQASPSRLRQLFENLLRNAVEHGALPAASADEDGSGRSATVGSSPLAVTVGTVPGGFFVEDDGVGIPEEERSRVFERGVTSAEDGTGLGLAIVRRIVEAHGWTVVVTEGEAGGARFEVTGVEVADAGG